MPAAKRSPARSDSAQSTDSESDLGARKDTGSTRKRLKVDNSSEDFNMRGVQTVKVHILKAKMTTEEVVSLEKLAKSRALVLSSPAKGLLVFKLCNQPQDSEVIITNIRMRKRFERSVSTRIAADRAVVTPAWLIDSMKQGAPQPCENYAALRELRETTRENCPDQSQTQDTTQATDVEFVQGSSTSQSQSEASKGSLSSLNENSLLQYPSEVHYSAHYSCQRFSPLACPNQELVQQLGVIMHSRELDGETINMLSYERAIATIKAYPHKITEDLLGEVHDLPFVGGKTMTKVKEYLSTGQVYETKTILATERYHSLSSFSKIYGIGPSTARELYDVKGLRTIEQLRKYYDVDVVIQKSLALDTGEAPFGDPPDLSIPHALLLMDDLNEKIPRREVEEIRDLVMGELATIESGFKSVIVGGYRRGKEQSNDVDIVIGHSDPTNAKRRVTGLSRTLVRRLYHRGVVKHAMHLSSFHAPHAMRSTTWDSLEKAMTVLILPPDPKDPDAKRYHRRVDLIFAAPESYWTAVLGWTGSKMFQRDLRKWAKDKMMLKFDSSGITRRHDSKQLFPKSEEDVFRILGLEWIPPEMRNADL